MSVSPLLPILLPSVFVGRAAQLDFLSGALDRARAGKGATVLVSGEAGIGKTRLAAETRTLAVARGFEFLSAECSESDRTRPFAPIAEFLRVFASEHNDAAVQRAFAQTLQLLRLTPELEARTTSLNEVPPFDPLQLPHAFVEFILALARPAQQRDRNAPLFIFFEDLHWSDEATLDCLRALVRRVSARPILLLVTYRDNEMVPAMTEWVTLIARRPDVFELPIAPLTRAEMDELICGLFNQTKPTRSEFLDALASLTEGNPFYIDQVIKSLVATGDIYFGSGGWTRKPVRELRIPRTLQAMVAQRLQGLAPEARKVMNYAAVIGRRFDFALLRRLTEMTEANLLDLFRTLLNSQLVVEESEDGFAFRHELTRQAAYSALLLRERKQLHRVVGEAMETLFEDATHARVSELAYHFYAAGDWGKAATYSQRAAEEAQRLYAPRTAVELWTRALHAMRELGVAPPANLYHARGKAYALIGTFEPARADLEMALDLASPDARLEWELLLELAFLWSGRDYSRTRAYLERALEMARALNDPAALGRSLNRLGNYLANTEQVEQAIPYHREALTAFRQMQDAHGLAETYDLLATSLVASGDWMDGSRYYLQAVTQFRALDNRAGLASSLSMSSFRSGSYLNDTMITLDSAEQALADGFAALELAQQTQQHAAEAMASSALVMTLGWQGEYGRAWELANKGLALAEEIEHRHWEAFARIALGALALDTLAWEDARLQLENALRIANEIGSDFFRHLATAFLVSTLVAQKELGQALDAFDAVIRPGTFAASNTQRQVWAARAELALAQQEPEVALDIVMRLIETAPQLENFGSDSIPRLAALRGESLAQLGRWQDAEERLNAAVQSAQQQGARGHVWRSLARLARAQLAQGNRAASAQAIGRARAILAELASNLSEARRGQFVTRAAAQLPEAPLTPRRAAKLQYAGLTAREGEIARLIARGASNREIAAQLVLSHRTVEGHISNILTKLGLGSRTEIAVWVTEHHL